MKVKFDIKDNEKYPSNIEYFNNLPHDAIYTDYVDIDYGVSISYRITSNLYTYYVDLSKYKRSKFEYIDKYISYAIKTIRENRLDIILK